jgi:hypothetical protein
MFGGTKNMNEANPAQVMGYTASTSSTSDTVNFSGGAVALTDFTPYQHILIGRELYCILKILNNTQIIVGPRPTANAAGLPVRRVPNLNRLTRQTSGRASLYAGNVVRYREEAIFAVGRGTLRINGAPIVASLTASSTPQVAYPLPGGTYDVRPVGFTRPTIGPLFAVVGGGTKGMVAGQYSIRVSKKRKGFPGYGLASTPVIATLGAGQQFQVTLNAFDALEGQTAWYVWVSRNDDVTTGGSLWQLLGEYTQLTPFNIEWLDGELGEEYVDDNFPPPPTSYVVTANDRLIFLGFGDAPDGSGNPTSPGPGCAVSKSNNPEAFSPVDYAFISPAEEIVGVKAGKVGVRTTDAMVYIMSPSALNIGRFTDTSPSRFICIPFALAGFVHQHSGCVAYDFFYGLAGDTLIRTRDGENIETEFSEPVMTDLKRVENARTFVEFDPKNGLVVIIQANAILSGGGGWQSRAWSYNTKTGNWNTPVLLGNGVSDFTVCGVASIGERMYFVTTAGETYEWDDGGDTISGMMAVGFDSFGGAQFDKVIRLVKITANIPDGVFRLYKNYDKNGLLNSGTPLAQRGFGMGFVDQIQELPAWRPELHVYSLGWIFVFNSKANFEFLDNLEIAGYLRTGLIA